MIKYKKVLIFLSLCLVFLFLPNKVSAAGDDILMYMDCSYNISHGVENIKKDNVSIYSTELHVAYTEILDSDEKTYKVKVTDSSGSFYENLNENFNSKFDIKVVETNRTRSTFTAAYAANAKSCPKYMTVEHDSGKEYTVLFSNELSDICAGEPGTQCKMIYNFSKNNHKIYISPSEDVWTYSEGANSAKICDHLKMDLTVSTSKQIKILATYTKESSYEKYTNWAKPKTVQVVWFSDIANLARNMKVNIVTIDPDTDNFGGTTGVHFTSQDNYNWYYSATLDTACEFTSPLFTSGKTCTTYEELKTTVAGKLNAAYDAVKSIDDIGTKYLNYTSYNNIYSVKSFTTETDADALLASATEIDTALTTSTFTTASADLTNYLKGLSEDDKLCDDTRDIILKLLDSYGDYNDLKNDKIALLEETYTKMKARLLELNEPDKAALLDGYIANAQTLQAALATVTANARASYLKGMKFNIGEIDGAECGIISTDLLTFLQTIIDYIRIAGIVIAVIFGILDYIKVIFGSDDKSMSKANKNFSIRLIAVALLFLLPAILNFILGLFNVVGTGSAGTCGLK